MESYHCCLASYISGDLNDLDSRPESLEALSDFALKTEDGAEFAVHRLVLVHASQYFKALIFNNLNQSSVLIPGVARSTLREILSYVYRRTSKVTTQNVCAILRAADFFLLGGLVEVCIQIMEEEISLRNAVEFYLTSLNIWHLGIQTRCLRYIQTNFEWVILESDGIQHVPYEILRKFLMDDYTNVSGEATIWKAIVKWTEYEVEERSEYVYSLLRCIRFSHLNKSYIEDVILQHPIVQKNNHCCKMLNDVMKNPSEHVRNHNSEIHELALQTGLTCAETRIRKPSHVYFFIELAFGDSEQFTLYEMYDEEFDHCRKIIRITGFLPDVLHAIHDTLFIFESLRDIRLAYSITCRHQWNWRFLPPHLTPRYKYNLLCLNNKLYAVGGSEQITSEQLTTVEVYDPTENAWSELKPMNKILLGPAEVLDGKIFIIGNYYDEYLKGIVICGECYNPENDTWTILRRPRHYRQNFAMVAYRGFLYIIGGRNRNGLLLRTAERYDPTAEEWSAVNCMPHEYRKPKAMVFRDVLIVCEADTKTEESAELNTPIFWDEVSSDWRELSASWAAQLYKCLFAKVDDVDVIQQIRPCRQPAFPWRRTFTNDKDEH